MYKHTALGIVLCAAATGLTAPSYAAQAPEPQVSTSVRNVTTEPLGVLYERALEAQREEAALKGGKEPAAATGERVREIPRHERPLPSRGPRGQVDTAVQRSAVPGQAAVPATPKMPATEQNFEGQPNLFGVLPPDTDGDVGPDHYVQMVNLSLAVYDKTGVLLLGPVASNFFWAPLGGICASNNDGDPIVLYDQGADRWLISQFALGFPNNFHECVAISQTGNPTGAWYQYDFLASTTQMNDYPKFGVWPDGYYMSANDFDGSTLAYAGVSAYAFERAKMLNGLPAQMVKFDLAAGDDPYSMLPADWDGLTAPPPGAPNPFVYMQDDAWGYPADALKVWNFHVDWVTPPSSTFSFVVSLPTAPFDTNMCGYDRNCIPQPGGTPVDAISDRLMFRNQYRNLGGSQAMVFNHTVDTNGADHAGVRWYELTDTGGGWGIAQQGTYAPDGNNRWMGSIAMDKDGNLALGYSVSSTGVYPSILYTGRLAGDPANTLPQGEQVMILGSGSQSHSSGRWGDYSAMAVDPVDDCTFWYTQEYYAADSVASWQTRIGSFRFPSCVSGPTGSLVGNVASSGSGDPITGAQVAAGAQSTFTDAAGDYGFPIVPVGTYSVTASAYGYLSATAGGVSILEGMTTTQNFALSPAPPIQVCGAVTDGSGQGWPLYARLAIAGGPVGPTFTDPVTGQYCVDLFEDASYTFQVSAESGGYTPETRTFTANPGNATQDFALLADLGACNAPGYSKSGLSDDFESGYGNWTMSGLWNPEAQSDACGSIAAPFPSPTNAAYYGIDGTCTYNNGANGGSLTLNSAFPVAAGDTLDFQSYQETECDGGFCFFDDRIVEISTDGGASWNPLGGVYHPELVWAPVSLDLSAYAGSSARIRFRFETYDDIGNDYFGWMVDNISAGACAPIPGGGLAVGNVYDANNGNGINGATVADGLVHSATTFPTPDDTAQQDGFYVLFSLAGGQTLTATAPSYGADIQTPAVIGGGVVEQDFNLPAVLLLHLPPAMDFMGPADSTWTDFGTLLNNGGLPANFTVKEVNAPYLAPVATGPFADHARRLSPKHLNDRDAQALYLKEAPAADPLAAGDVIQSWPTGLPYAWGIGYNLVADDLWLGDIGAAGGTDKDYRYLTNGSPTGDSIDVSGWVGAFAADMTYNPNTGMLWQVNVDGDNCIYELDPVAKVATSSKICPAFGTSERGLAYDPTTDTYYSGSWNDGVINHFAPNGTLLDSAFVGLNISGLAYNPDTGHLFVMTNSESSYSYDVYVLDAQPGAYPVIGGFDIAGLGDYEQAGLEIDCAGNLWAVNQATQMVIQAESGETGVCAYGDIPWLAVNPTGGTVAPVSGLPLAYNLDTSGMAPGTYEAHVRIENDGPYGPVIVPVTLTVTTAIPPEADLSIVKTDDVDPIVSGNQLTYTVTVTNNGPDTAVNVVVTDTLPAGVTFVSTSGCVEDPNGVPTCSLGNLASGASASYSIVVKVGIGTGGTIVNQASVTSATDDPNTGNNGVTEDTQVKRFGDQDGDNCIGSNDVTILLNDVRAGTTNPATQDINGDGAVNRADGRALMQLYTNPTGVCP